MENKMRRYLKLFPWSTALSMDLLVWVAINTLFLKFAKGFTDDQIVLSSTIALVVGIVLQYPVMKLIHILGNTWSYRVGTFCYLSCALLIILGDSFFLVVTGLVLCQMAYTFTSVSDVILQNNLELAGREVEFVPYRTKANTIYSVTTMVIALVASTLFNWNYYLPMLCSLGFCIISTVCAFFIKDYSPYDRITKKPAKVKNGKLSLGYSKYVLMVLLASSIASAVMSVSQTEGKLFVQQTLLTEFDVDKTAYLLTGAVLVSRITRVASNMCFAPLYRKLKQYLHIFLTCVLLTALVLIILGYALPIPIMYRFLIMAAGFAFTMFSWDVYITEAKTQVLTATHHEQHQTIMTVMTLGRRITNAIINMAMTAVILRFSMVWAIVILAGLAVVQLGLNIYVLRLMPKKTQAQQV
jgi:hypothetical protein